MKLTESEQNAVRRYLQNVAVVVDVLNRAEIPHPDTVSEYGAFWHVYEERDYGALTDEKGEYPLIRSALETLKALRRAFPGVIWEKIATDFSFGYRGTYQGTRVQFTSARDAVCERIDTGETEEYEEREILEERKVTKIRPKYEWKCPE